MPQQPGFVPPVMPMGQQAQYVMIPGVGLTLVPIMQVPPAPVMGMQSPTPQMV